MTTNNQPVMDKKQLMKSIIIAFLIGVAVLLVAILPAEYGIDPLGTGELFGFNKLYVNDTDVETEKFTVQKNQLDFKKIKLKNIGSPIGIYKNIEANSPPPNKQYTEQNDTINVAIPAGKGVEYKFKALKYASVKYEWTTKNNEIVFIDFHGEVKQKNPPKEVFYESYTLAYSNNMAGTLTVPFEGKHGWYFKNNNEVDIIITICLIGQYKLFDKK